MLICNCSMMAQTDKEYHIKTSDGVMLYVHMRGQGTPCLCHTDGEKIMMIEDYWADFRPLASTVTVPVLFFVGNKDRAIGPDSYRDIHFPKAIIRIGNCGHFPFLESPKEWASALDDYSKLLRNKK